MTPLDFYYRFGIFVECFPLIPILLGVKKWEKLPIGTKFFLGFLAAEILFSGLTHYWIKSVDSESNLYLFYINSFFQSVFILAVFWHFFEKRIMHIIICSLWCLCLILLGIDFLWVSRKDYNYLSQFCINLIISGLSFYYFFANFPRYNFKNSQFNETELILSAALVLQFFIKSINIFLEKFLLETQNNTFLSIQTRNVNAYFMLLSLLIYTYAFYHFKANET